MSGILRLESLTKGNTLKQGDKTPLKYRLFDADGEKLNIAGKSAKVRLVYPDFLTIGYEKDGLTVAQDDTVTFTIDKVISAKLYHVEIIVDDKFIFPSRADESKFMVDKSSLGTESSIIEIVGVDTVVKKAVDLINKDPNLIIDEEKLVNDIIKNTGIGNVSIKGYNEFPRGDFAEDNGSGLANGLINFQNASVTFQPHLQKFRANSEKSGIAIRFNPTANDVYFITVLVRATSNAVGLKTVDKDNNWIKDYHAGRGFTERLSILSTISDTSSNIRITDDKKSGFSDVEVRNLVILNVSKIFGAQIPSINFLEKMIARLGWVGGDLTTLTTQVDLIEHYRGLLKNPYRLVVNDTDGEIEYVGDWEATTGLNHAQYLGGTRHLAKKSGDYLKYNFYGSGISVYAGTSTQRGMVEIFIDDVSRGVVNMASSTAIFNNLVFEVSELDSKSHTIKIVVAEHFDSLSAVPYFDFNRFEVIRSDVVSNKVLNKKTNSDLEFWVGTQAEYDLITAPNEKTIYLIGD